MNRTPSSSVSNRLNLSVNLKRCPLHNMVTLSITPLLHLIFPLPTLSTHQSRSTTKFPPPPPKKNSSTKLPPMIVQQTTPRKRAAASDSTESLQSLEMWTP